MSKAAIISTEFKCMVCGEEVKIEDPIYIIHKRKRRDSFLDYDFLLICEKCGDEYIGPIKEKVRRRFANV